MNRVSTYGSILYRKIVKSVNYHQLQEKAGATCVCSPGKCEWVPKKEGFKCVHESVCPLPDFQGAKFNYVIDADEGDDWAYMRFRFRPVFENKFHPEWNSQRFWDQTQWTGIIACPFSSYVDDKDTVDGIYFETGSVAYGGKMHTVMGRSGHRLEGEKGEVLRSALRTPDGAPWSRKYKGYTCEVGVVPGHWPNLAECLEAEFGEFIYEHFQTALTENNVSAPRMNRYFGNFMA